MITADGSYGARLARDGESWFPERWTLDGPEPYAVPLPGNQPEEPGTEVLPMTDGRVLIHRVTDGRHVFSLLYPTGPATGELPLGAVECLDAGTRLRLLPPAPGGERAYALATGPHSTAVWLVAGGTFGPEHLAEVPGRCSGGVWLDGTERLLALDRQSAGRTKTIVVDLERGGEVSPLLQIAEDSNDRLLLADADSGLLLIRSDAPSPGHDRLGWGVLGSTLPVRFPESLRLAGCSVTPFAIQPGQVLTPESCAVALRIDGATGTWVGVWRPAERQVHHLPAPEGWLAGSGLWSRDGVLQLPYASGTVACGVVRTAAPVGPPDAGVRGSVSAPMAGPADSSVSSVSSVSDEPVVARPVPLQQAPLAGRPRPARKRLLTPTASVGSGWSAAPVAAPRAATVAAASGGSGVTPAAPDEQTPVTSLVAHPTVLPPAGTADGGSAAPPDGSPAVASADGMPVGTASSLGRPPAVRDAWSTTTPAYGTPAPGGPGGPAGERDACVDPASEAGAEYPADGPRQASSSKQSPTWIRVAPPTSAVRGTWSPVIPVRPAPVPAPAPAAAPPALPDPADPTDPPTTRLSPIVPEPVPVESVGPVGSGAPLPERTAEAAASVPEPVVWVAVRTAGDAGTGEAPAAGGESAVAPGQRTVAAG